MRTHPKAKRKEITRAALAVMIQAAEGSPHLAVQLQDFAISQRAVAADDD